MPWSLHRYQQTGEVHFVTFSCYRRRALLQSPHSRDLFEATLERVRRWYGMLVGGYVVMPEHVHLGEFRGIRGRNSGTDGTFPNSRVSVIRRDDLRRSSTENGELRTALFPFREQQNFLH